MDSHELNAELNDKREIAEVLYRYASGVDTGDWDLWRTVFTPDAFLDYRAEGTSRPAGKRDEIGAWLEGSVGKLPMRQHYITNIEIELNGDRAKVRAMFFNPMKLPQVEGLSYCGGYYYHDMVRTPEGWKSERLVEDNVWFENPPAES